MSLFPITKVILCLHSVRRINEVFVFVLQFILLNFKENLAEMLIISMLFIKKYISYSISEYVHCLRLYYRCRVTVKNVYYSMNNGKTSLGRFRTLDDRQYFFIELFKYFQNTPVFSTMHRRWNWEVSRSNRSPKCLAGELVTLWHETDQRNKEASSERNTTESALHSRFKLI